MSAYRFSTQSQSHDGHPRMSAEQHRARAPAPGPASAEQAGRARRSRMPQWARVLLRLVTSAAMLIVIMVLLVALIVAVAFMQAASASLP